MKSITILYFIFTCLFHFSCRKFVDIEPAPGLIHSDLVFSNDKTALSAVGGLYVQMTSGAPNFTCAGLSVFTGLTSDEIYNTAASETYDPFFTNSLLPGNVTVHTNFWSAAYKNIYRSNAIMEGLQLSKTVTDSVRSQLLGEMKLVRALNYFYLVNLFGPVPLVISTDYRTTAVLPRREANIIYDQIEKDLQEAQSLLKPAYPSTGKIRPNLWSATSLLARAYLFQSKWTLAEEQAGKVIGSGMYSLPALNAVFLKNSAETIWELAAINDAQITGPAVLFVPSSATVRPGFAVTAGLFNAFETGDNRKTAWLKQNTVSGTAYHYPHKQKQRTGTPVTEYNVVFRLAEVYLVRAEARAQTGNLPGAVSDLNLVRGRAGLPPTIAITKEELLSAIEHERRTEFFSEWGHRWLDLKRTGKAVLVLPSLKGINWQNTDVLFPIPQYELDYNPALTQNPGY